MTKLLAILGGVGIGVAFMYLFDPDGGRRRRALIRDKAVGLSNDVIEAVDKKTTHFSNRAHGLLHEAKSFISKGEPETQNYGGHTA